LDGFLPKVCFNGDRDCLDPGWVGWLAISANLVGCVISMVMAKVTDIFRGRLKLWIIMLFVLSGIFFAFLGMITLQGRRRRQSIRRHKVELQNQIKN
jgi:hypothetical protein